MKWQALKYKNRFLFFCEEIDFCQKQHAATQHLFLLDFKSFQEESFSKLAHLDTTARSMERKKRFLFKESLCVVNRIKGDGESHLSLSLMSPGHSCVASTGEKGFHIPCSPRNPAGGFSLSHNLQTPCVFSSSSQTPLLLPTALLCLVKPGSTHGRAASSQGLLCSACTNPGLPHGNWGSLQKHRCSASYQIPKMHLLLLV